MTVRHLRSATALAVLGIGASAATSAASPGPAAGVARRHGHHGGHRALPVKRAGCSQYCQQAGGYGGGPGGRNVVRFLGPVRVSHDGTTATIRMRCVFRRGCRGALLLNFHDASGTELGRCDMELAGKERSVIALTLSPAGRDLLAHQPPGPVRILATADAGVTFHQVPRRATHGWVFVVGVYLKALRS